MKPSKKKKHIHLVLPEKAAEETSVVSAQPLIPRTDHRQIATQIADEMGETRVWPRGQIRHIVYILGSKQAQALALRAREIEDAGGMLALNGKHRRTVGGIFFHLCYTEGKPRPGKVLTRPAWKPRTSEAPNEPT